MASQGTLALHPQWLSLTRDSNLVGAEGTHCPCFPGSLSHEAWLKPTLIPDTKLSGPFVLPGNGATLLPPHHQLFLPNGSFPSTADMPVSLIDHGCEHDHTLSPSESFTWGRFWGPLIQLSMGDTSSSDNNERLPSTKASQTMI